MATFNITIPARSNQGEVNELSMLTNVTLPSDYVGSVVTDVAIVGTPSITTNSGPTDDDLLIRMALQTNAGNIVGDYNSNTTCVAYANLPDGVSSDNWTDGSSPTGLPRTGASGDFSRVGFTVIVTPNMKNDGETIDWASFQVQVTYFPTVFEMHGWRWYDDDNSDPDSFTPISAENEKLEWRHQLEFNLRVGLTGSNGANTNVQLQHRVDGGSWVNSDTSGVTAVNGPPVSGSLCDTALISTSTSSFSALGEYDETDCISVIRNTSGATVDVELSYNLLVSQAVQSTIFGGELIEFRLTIDGNPVPLRTGFSYPSAVFYEAGFFAGDTAAWRWYDPDNSDPDSCTALAAEDTSYTVDLDTDIALRIKVVDDIDADFYNLYQLQYQVGAGSWFDVNGTSSNIRSSTTGTPSDGALCNTELLTAETETFNANGTYDEVDGGATITATADVTNAWELMYCITARSADLSGGETINFRLVDILDRVCPLVDGSNTQPVLEIASAGGGPVLGEITFGSSQNQQTTIQLSGLASQTLLTQLLQNQTNTKTTTETTSLNINLLQTNQASLQFFETALFELIADQTNTNINQAVKSITLANQQNQQESIQMTGLAAHTLLTQLSQDQINVKNTIESINISIDLTQLSAESLQFFETVLFELLSNQTTFETISTEESISINTQVDASFINNLLGSSSISLDSILDFNNTVQADLARAITYLNNLDFTVVGDTQALIEEAITFAANNIYTPEVSAIFQKSISLINTLDTIEQKTLLASGAVTLLSNMQMQQTATAQLLEAINLIANFDQVSTNNITTSELVDLVLNAAQESSVAITFEETLFITTQLLSNYTGSRALTVNFNFNSNLTQLQTNVLDKVGLILFDGILDQLTTTQIDFTASIQLLAILSESVIGETTGNLVELITFANTLNQVNIPQINFLEDVQFISSLDLTSNLNRILSATNSFNIDLDQIHAKLLNKALIISFNSLLNELDTTQIDFAASIQLLAILSELAVGETTSNLVELITFANTLNQVNIPQINFLEDVQFISSLDLTSNINRILSATNSFNINLDQIHAKLLNKALTISFNSLLNELDTTQIDFTVSIQLLAILSELAVGETTGNLVELITFANTLNQINVSQANLIEAAQFSSNLDLTTNLNRILSATNNFNIDLDQIHTKLLDKALAISFNSVLDKINTGQIDFGALIVFANVLSTTYIGETTGNLEALITFAMQLQKDDIGLTVSSKNISYNTLLSQTGFASKALIEALSLNIQLDQTQLQDRLVHELVQFDTLLNEINETQIDFRPTINFNLEALEASSTQKNTLANLLLNLDAGFSLTSGLPALISYAVQQDLVSEVKLVAEGELILSTDLLQSETNKLLAESGITFGHLLALSSLSKADFAQIMSFGTVTDVSVNGFVLELFITLPSNRTCVLQLEDRTMKVYKEDRIIKLKNRNN